MSSAAVQDADRLLAAGRREDAIRRNAAAVRSGDSQAMFQAALWRLIGAPLPRDVPAARDLLRQAAALGHIDATMMEIALTANGSGAPADWPTARRLLERAASTDVAAAEQLRLLRAMDLTEDGHPAVLPGPEQLDPRCNIKRFRVLLTPAECAHVASTVQHLLTPAVVIDPNTGRQMRHPIRTSDGTVIGPTREDLVIRAINQRIAAVTETDVAQGEALSVLRYAPGQEYRPHLDTIAGAANQRIRTLLLYLNDGYVGGETRFTRLGLTIMPRQGDAIVFDNVDATGRPVPNSEHAGLPVTRGTKWLATRWIRAKTMNPWQPAN